MDLIYTNANREDIGALQDYELDLAFGADENNFECRIQSKSHCCEAGSLLYIEGTEYGGIIDNIESNTASGEVVYSGRSWHGVLNSKVLEPDAGESHLVVTGEANSIIASLVARMGLTDLFEVATDDSGFNVTNYRMNRYITGYDGICKMLESVGAKLAMTFEGGKVILYAVAVYDFSQAEEFDSDIMDFTFKKAYKTVNHLVCLGTGELENRMIVHLYADENGNISQTQMFFGLDEYADTYDYPNVETEEDLIEGGIARLKELQAQSEITIDFDETEDLYDVGDIVGSIDNVVGIVVTVTVTKKIVSIRNGRITIDLETNAPDARMSSVKETASNAATAAASAQSTANNATSVANNATSAAQQAQETANSKISASDLLNLVYPVGSIYMSTNSTSPQSFLGGTWTQITGCFLLAAGGGYSAGATGGEATHTLTTDEMPSHTHTISLKYGNSGSVTTVAEMGTTTSATTTTVTSTSTGGGEAHNNMPPYLAVYVWKRTK